MSSRIAANVATGIATGLEKTVPVARQAERAEARVRQESGKQKLKAMQATEPSPQDYQTMSENQSAQLEQTQSDLKAQANKSMEMASYSAFNRYEADNDVRHLNTMLTDAKQTEAGRKLYGEAVRFDPVTAADSDMLTQAGFDPKTVLENPEVAQDIVKVTMADGTVKPMDMQALQQLTRYDNYKTNAHLAREKLRAEIISKSKSGQGSTAGERFAYAKTVEEGLDPKTQEFETRRIAIMEEQQAKKARTAVQKNLSMAEEAEDTIRDKWPDFFSPDKKYSSMDKVQQERYIQRIELGAKATLSEGDKKQIANIKSLISLGDPATKLTKQETGLFDKPLKTLKTYISDNVKGTIATAAFATFRNTLRHAISGSALTEAEIKAFNESMGTLGQQLGPILERFKLALGQVRAKLDSVRQTNNSYVIQYRLGSDSTRLDGIIDNLDERLERLSGAERGYIVKSKSKSTSAPAAWTGTPERRAEIQAMQDAHAAGAAK